MLNDNLGFKTRVRVVHNGNSVVDTHNTIVTTGKSKVAGLLVADVSAGSPIDWMGIGLGSSTISAGNTVLGSQYLKYGLGSITGTLTTTTTTNDTARWIGSFGIDATKIVNEAGLFDKSGLDVGSMLSRTTFADVNTISGDRLNITWDIAVS